jgi:hypothetical protein
LKNRLQTAGFSLDHGTTPSGAAVWQICGIEALAALLARNRAAEIDAAYAAYDRFPLDTSDEWGDLASFRRAAGAS